MEESEGNDQINSNPATSGDSQNRRNWREKNSENKFLNDPNKGYMNQAGRSGIAEDQWRTNRTENRFFGERSTDRKHDENWRSNQRFGEGTSSTTSDNNFYKPFAPQTRLKKFVAPVDTRSKPLNERRHNKQAPPKKRVTFDTTEILTKQPDELITFLVENLTDFEEFLAPPLPTNTVVQLVSILEKVCGSKTNIKFSNVILSRLHKNFMNQLDKYFVKLSLDEEDDKVANELFWNNPETFWNSLLVVFENVIDRLQKFAIIYLDKVIKTSLVTILFHKNSHGIKLDNISKKLTSLKNRLGNLKKISYQTEDDCQDNYQTMSVYPDPNEVLSRKKPFLRQNIIDGSYMSVEHYLDTHFRLLREDFLAPLREAICTYKDSLQNNERVKITEFRVYSKTCFDHYSDGIEDSDYDLSYIGNNVRRRTFKMVIPGECNKKYVNNEEAFMPGGLLCFSSDNFQTMFFGISAKLRGTRKGLIDVQLLEDVPFLENKEYTMLECCNYFGTYFVVLKSLQNLSTDNFPMEKYIINVVNDPQPPGYVKSSTRLTIGNLNFTVLDDKTWPTKEQLNLNEMQYDAFKQALQSKCAIIQGPPGTGKTHLGLKIAQTLIENNATKSSYQLFSDLSDDEDDMLLYEPLLLHRLSLSRGYVYGPILVVAYTNHALDQFLQGLMPYTKKIVRIGHQGKNDNISQFRFYGVRRNGNILNDYYWRIEEIISRGQKLMNALESILSYRGIFDLKKLVEFIPEVRESPVSKWSDREIIIWLFGASSTEQERQDRREMANELEKNFGFHNTYIPRYTHYSINYILTLSELKRFAATLRKKLDFKDVINLETMFEDWYDIEESYIEIQDNIQYLEWRLKNAAEHINLYALNPIDDTGNLLELSYNDRWILYFHWLDSYAEYLKNAMTINNATLQRVWEELEDHKQREDSELIKKATVVGMTTSGAAKHRHLLENLKCRIVIVEEAAEVLESHIIISLTQHCQHLILIGDHQQLRPSTTDYQIEKQYQLGISLFERLIRNNISYSTLDIQHRMRPEISRLIVPAIYENLQDHASVNNFPNIEGIKHNVFFITHPHPEVEIGNSRKNPYEAKYLLALARHLILQGNPPSEITILTTYKGQMYAIMDEQKENNFAPLQKVQVTVVDNFQGEENQIILLSLVRSNNEGSIGFLRVENRVCVALSRAKKGFYIMGNMEILTSCSKIWPKVNDVLEKNQQIGPGLEMACQLHPENAIIAVKPEDFLKVPDGGCHLSCKADLKCGHVCQRKCHVTDVNHRNYQCMEPCAKILCSENHQCQKKCWEKCERCQVPMQRSLPCGHEQMVPCSMQITEFKCPVVVETLLTCNHIADKPCFENKYTFKCQKEVEVTKPECRHVIKKKCFESVYTITCNAVVITKLNCGHDGERRCWYKDNPLFKRSYYCRELCLKNLECGHICEKICHYNLDRTHSTAPYQCTIKCTKLKVGCKTNHICDLLCSEPCQPCRNNINITLPCGHSKMIPCHKSDRKYTCNELCKKTKPCGHACHGKCHITCNSMCFYKVSKSFPNCGHKIRGNCSDDLRGKECMKCLKKKDGSRK